MVPGSKYSGMKTQNRILILCLLLLSTACGPDRTEDFTVMKGDFRQTITETGELEAISAAALVMPRISYEYGYEFTLIGLAENGKMVKQGDTVIRLDPSSIEKFIITKTESLESEKAAEKKQRVQLDNTLQELRAQLRAEQATFDLRKLELERSKYEPENKRKIKELEFSQATIRMNKLTRQIDRKPKIDNYDFRIQQIRVQQIEAVVASARESLRSMVMTSPRDGLFQLGDNQQEWPPKLLKIGDRTWSGSLIARIPDVQHMKVRTFVNEVDITRISRGLKVIVRLDALPDIAFHGVITDISRISTLREKQMVFRVVVEIEESDLRLKPGMTVSCEYVCSEIPDALFVPNNCLLREDGKAYIFLKRGATPVKTEVRAGVSNSHHTLISGDFKPGQELIPFEQVITEKKS